MQKSNPCPLAMSAQGSGKCRRWQVYAHFSVMPTAPNEFCIILTEMS